MRVIYAKKMSVILQTTVAMKLEFYQESKLVLKELVFRIIL